MEKMKIFTMKLRDKMKNQRPKEDNEQRGSLNDLILYRIVDRILIL